LLKHSDLIKGTILKLPYNFFGTYLREKYGFRVLKLPINADLSCPNRNGTLSNDGCVFCSDDGSAAPTASGTAGIREQMEAARKSFRRSEQVTGYIAYFQAYTNTYDTTENLKKVYDEAVKGDDIVGLMVGTRPDCVSDEVLDLLASYDRPGFEIWLEIGMQSMHNRSLQYLNRHHDHHSTRDAAGRAADRGLNVCVHIILGIPGETWKDMMDTADEVASMPVKGVKFHHLHVIKNTKLEELFNKEQFKTLSLKEYSSIVCDFIERLRPDIIIHRLMGDREESTLVAPLWGIHKGTVLNSIESEFERRGSWQGILYCE
jgi:radical SAM protein (TIGR01212 family)